MAMKKRQPRQPLGDQRHAAGTSELSVADVFHSGGLDPHDIVAFGNKALFAGFDASGLVGLWVTNGTGGGTHEFSVAGANSTVGLNPFNLTVFGNEVLFQGLGCGRRPRSMGDQWHCCRNLGAVRFGHRIRPTNTILARVTVFGNEVLFQGDDASGDHNLWVTNGTGPGNLGAVRLRGRIFRRAEPLQFHRCRQRGAVRGRGYERPLVRLWVTNGTAAGTSELTVSGAASPAFGPTNMAGLFCSIRRTADRPAAPRRI